MCLEEEMPENSIALAEKEEQIQSIRDLPGDVGRRRRGTQCGTYPQGRLQSTFLQGASGESKATSPPSRGEQIPAVVYFTLEFLSAV